MNYCQIIIYEFTDEKSSPEIPDERRVVADGEASEVARTDYPHPQRTYKNHSCSLSFSLCK